MSESSNGSRKSVFARMGSIDTTLGFIGSTCIIYGFNANKLLLLFGVLGVAFALSPLIWESPKLKLLTATYYFVVGVVFLLFAVNSEGLSMALFLVCAIVAAGAGIGHISGARAK